MSDFEYDVETKRMYDQQREEQIVMLNKIIVGLRTKIVMLEKEIKDRENTPVPSTVKKQFLEMELKIRKLEEDLAYYKKQVPKQVIINRENQNTPTRRGGLR